MYTLVGSTRSRAFRVLWLLEELGQPYTHVSAGPQSDEVRRYSPLGKVPVLLDGEDVIPDSSAILTYLADKHGACTAPAGTLARARQDAMTFRILDELEGQLWTAAKHSFVLPEAERFDAVKPSLKAEFARNLAAISTCVQGDYLMGDDLTVPDILLVHCLGWARNAGFPDAPDALMPYLKRARSRPAFQRAAAA